MDPIQEMIEAVIENLWPGLPVIIFNTFWALFAAYGLATGNGALFYLSVTVATFNILFWLSGYLTDRRRYHIFIMFDR